MLGDHKVEMARRKLDFQTIPEEEELEKFHSNRKENGKFQHLYAETFYFISRKCQQSMSTGYRPDQNCHFKFCVRLDDHRFPGQMILSYFQYISLIRDLRRLLCSEQEVKVLDKIDANISFKFKDVNAPTVVIIPHGTTNIPTFYRLALPNQNGEIEDGIIFQSKTLKKLVDWQCEILNTIKPLEQKACNYSFKVFIENSVEFLKKKNSVEIDPKKLCSRIRYFPKTPFQSEMYLKFWPEVCREIISKLSVPNYEEVV